MTNVMIVDDDGLMRATLSSLLARAGFGVCTSSDAVRAQRLAEVAPPSIALVGMSALGTAIELVRALKQRYGTAIYVAAMTGDDTPETRAVCEAAGADEVLAKPIGLADLRRRLTAIARTRGSGLDP
jgi:DNA-binding response OmpR family regulator